MHVGWLAVGRLIVLFFFVNMDKYVFSILSEFFFFFNELMERGSADKLGHWAFHFSPIKIRVF